MISRAELLAFMRRERYATQTSTSSSGKPQAAVVGIVVSEEFEVFFDTIDTSRKAINLRQNPSAAFVIGPNAADSSRTVQLEGVADEPAGPELEALLKLYFARFPDGKERQGWPGLVYFRVRPAWIRYSDFAADSREIVQFQGAEPRHIL